MPKKEKAVKQKDTKEVKKQKKANKKRGYYTSFQMITARNRCSHAL